MQLKVCGLSDAGFELTGSNRDAYTYAIAITNSFPGDGLFPAGWREFHGIKLELMFDDVDRIKEGYFAPGVRDIESVIALASALTESSRVLINCMQGSSRSPAVAFVLLCAYLGPGHEVDAYRRVQEAADRRIAPNARIVEIGDHLLGRHGAMVREFEAQRAARLKGDGEIPLTFT